MPDANGYFTYAEWERWVIDKITNIAFGQLNRVNSGTGESRPIEQTDREGYLRVQIEAAIRQGVRHGRSGRGEDDPVSP
jgi:hypothetical protein